MTDTSSANADLASSRGLLAWMTLPLALFPLVALLTYDWRAISALCTPPAPSTNWIGALGDGFAYYGYATFGLAIWIVPVVCVISALGFVRSRRVRSSPRRLWLGVFLLSVSCLLQVFGDRVEFLSQAVARLNIQNAGGWIGYLIMTRLLAPIVSDFGASVIMLVLMAASLVAAVGIRTLAAGCAAVIRWALAPRAASFPPEGADAAVPGCPGDREDGDTRFRAIRDARAAAKESARLEKERIKAEKQAAKEAARLEKERLRAEKQALKATQGRTRMWGGEAPVPPSAPVRPPSSAPAAAAEEDRTGKGPYVHPPL